jgi:hypothetical protein
MFQQRIHGEEVEEEGEEEDENSDIWIDETQMTHDRMTSTQIGRLNEYLTLNNVEYSAIVKYLLYSEGCLEICTWDLLRTRKAFRRGIRFAIEENDIPDTNENATIPNPDANENAIISGNPTIPSFDIEASSSSVDFPDPINLNDEETLGSINQNANSNSVLNWHQLYSDATHLLNNQSLDWDWEKLSRNSDANYLLNKMDNKLSRNPNPKEEFDIPMYPHTEEIKKSNMTAKNMTAKKIMLVSATFVTLSALLINMRK